MFDHGIGPPQRQLVFLNSGSDPYTNSNGGSMLSQNINTCNSVIGSANYDIGHVFSTGGGGVAYLQSPCGGSKAGGVTGKGRSTSFDVDYVAHEMGHRTGGITPKTTAATVFGRLYDWFRLDHHGVCGHLCAQLAEQL